MRDETAALLGRLAVPQASYRSGTLRVRSPITGEVVAEVVQSDAADTAEMIERAHKAYLVWRNVAAPKRGELVRIFGEELRRAKPMLGRLVSIEVGKILSEGLGEVQEMIDICDYAVGLSRQLYGLTIASERPNHRLMEQWHPAGVVGVISAFNFPTAVWSWNAALALVCGDSVVWKPSEKTPLTALAVQAIFQQAATRFGGVPEGLSSLIIGDSGIGESLVDHPDVSVISATGSTAMGRKVAARAARRFARTILELGGNNAAIVCPSADLDLAVRAIAFAAMGTAGQRCTTLRRLIVHSSVYDRLIADLKRVFSSVAIGSPLDGKTLIGPLIDGRAFDAMQKALAAAKQDGGQVHGGGRADIPDCAGGYYVKPALVEMPAQTDIVRHETFAPILYVLRYESLDEALALQNGVPQGLSSSIFSTDLREVELFLSGRGADCGIANVNMGPSGAEIGGAFGGEKETGGGRESGSDAWKGYMRRMTSAVNYGSELPLAQGVTFDIPAARAGAAPGR
ncbi:aldehyde dehydrogenase family protein [uncultured Bradyrhizobium sp.]|uniref:L-piperidine-6-carboxylate dehydrogenase n=1 Tax=uncultured Bradyrhizobium sp. TaxID=199684 RepID=UPI0035CB7C81